MHRLLCAVLPSLFVFAAVFAADAYPSRPVKLVIPYAEGSDSDYLARNLVAHVRKYLGQQFIQLEYLPGESGSKAAKLVWQASADGYTLLEGRISTQVIAPVLSSGIAYRPEHFTTIAIMEIVPLVCAVRSDSSYHNVRDLLNAIRKQPGTLKYSTSGQHSILNFSVQYLLHLAGFKSDAAIGIHTDSGAKATAALLNNQVQFTCNNVQSLIPHINSGKLRGLFTTAPGRLNLLPGLMNAREAGLRDMSQIIGWTALVGPPGLPPEIVARWRNAFAELAQDHAWLAGVEKQGALPALRAISEPERFIQDQARLYGRLAPLAGFRP